LANIGHVRAIYNYINILWKKEDFETQNLLFLAKWEQCGQNEQSSTDNR